MEVSEIVQVNLTRETRTVSQVGFGTILVLGPNLNVNARVATYTSLTALALELTGGVDALEYKAAQAILSQSPRVVSVKVGYQVGQKVFTDNAGTYTAGSISALVNGTVITQAYVTTKDDTLTALAAQIAVHAAVDTAAYSSGSHTITITPNAGFLVATTISTAAITGTMTMVLSSVATEDPDDSLTAIRLYDDDWYGLIYVDRTQADVELVATWTEVNTKIFRTASADADIVDVSATSDTTSIAATLKAAGYDRSGVIYDALAATTFPDAAELGKVFPYHPGVYTLAFKTLNGITRSLLSTTQSTNAHAKNADTYETTGGVNMVYEGKVASGEFFDTIVFCDWLVARVKEYVFRVFTTQLKVAFDDDGIQSVSNGAEFPFAEGVAYKGLKPYKLDSAGQQIGGYYFIVPALESISALDQAARNLTGFEAIGFLAGAVHRTAIAIKITL
jgi:hypothetical protein